MFSLYFVALNAQKMDDDCCLIYEGQDRPLFCSVKAYAHNQGPDPHILGVVNLGYHQVFVFSLIRIFFEKRNLIG